MLLKEIWENTLVKSSQFILAKSNVEIDVDRFKIIVQDALSVYNQSLPYSKEYSIYINQKPYIFVPEFDCELNRVPDYIFSCVPNRGVSTIAIGGGLFGTQNNDMDGLNIPLMAPYKYRKPNLTVTYTNCHYQITAGFKHIITPVKKDDGSSTTDYEIKTIDPEDQLTVLLFDLIRGHFLKGIGRSRKAFSLNDIPIVMDADALFTEGDALIEAATASIHLNKDIALAMG